MIKFENIEIYGWETVLRLLHYFSDGNESSDSHFDSEIGNYNDKFKTPSGTYIGKNDSNILRMLRDTNKDYHKIMEMLTVQVDITAPLYWWGSFTKHGVGKTVNSFSCLEDCLTKEFTIEDFSTERLLPSPSLEHFDSVVAVLNLARSVYLEIKDDVIKNDRYWQIVQLLPSSYNQKQILLINYEELLHFYNIYKTENKYYKDEWTDFAEWIETLPYFDLFFKYK